MLILTFIFGCSTQAAPPVILPPVEAPPAPRIPTVSVVLPTSCTRYIADAIANEMVIACFDGGSNSYARQVVALPEPPFELSIVHADAPASPLASKP